MHKLSSCRCMQNEANDAKRGVTPLSRNAAVLLVLLASSACVVVTPSTIEAAKAPQQQRAQVLAAWTQSITIANEFLASPYRRTLPSGSIELGPRGMRFVTDRGAWPLEVHCNPYGALVLAVGA